MTRPLPDALPVSTAPAAPVAAATAPPAVARPGHTPAPACIPSARLFAGAQEVQIDHHGMRYRLKQTALGKLILTK